MLLSSEYKALRRIAKGKKIDEKQADRLREKGLLWSIPEERGGIGKQAISYYGLDMMEVYRGYSGGILIFQIIAIAAFAFSTAAFFLCIFR